MNTKPTISQVFDGKVVLITGATGFLGKILLEKLLRSCPGISSILLLLRSTEKQNFDEKFSDLRNNPVFNRIKTECPDVLDKMHCLPGDIIDENLGLDGYHLSMVINKVSFVFHCAASVRFEEKPRKLFNYNILGVQNVLGICHRMKKLEAFVHVSTAYSFCNKIIIDEKIYPEKISSHTLLEALWWMNEDQLQSLSEYLAPGRPSLYHFSKAMAEICISDNCKTLPVIIVRPSIVTASVRDPFPGWIDNHNGPTGFIALSSKGLIRTLLVEKDITADWVPVDTVANTLIAAAHYISTQRKMTDLALDSSMNFEVPVINCVCPESNRITWSEVVDMCVPLISKYPSNTMYRIPGGAVTSSTITHTFCKVFAHYLPAFFVDSIMFLLWRKSNLVRSYQRIHKVMGHLQHYTTRRFIFTSNNMQNLVKEMSPDDREVFPIDQNNLIWPEYIENYVHGVRKFFLKEMDSTLPEARRKVLILQYMWLCSKITTTGILFLFLNNRFLKVHTRILSILGASKSLHWIHG